MVKLEELLENLTGSEEEELIRFLLKRQKERKSKNGFSNIESNPWTYMAKITRFDHPVHDSNTGPR